MVKPRTFGCVLLAASLLVLSPLAPAPIGGQASTSQAAELLRARTVTTTGKGSITASPDIARINIGVATSAKTAAAALKGNSEDMREVIAVLKGAGIKARDIQTSNLSVQPRMQRYRDGRAARVSGYQVRNQLHITARDLDRLGDILDAVVSAGANQIYGISFDVSDADDLIDGARGDAVTNARKKAELYARAAGATVGKIISISEQGTNSGRPPVVLARAARSSVPVERGSKTLEVRITATWELE